MTDSIRTLKFDEIEERLTFPYSDLPNTTFVLVPQEDVLAARKVIEASRWAHDKLNDEHDTCDCTCVACCGCFTEWLGEVKNYEEWCQLGAALRDLDGISSVTKPQSTQSSDRA
jgi:hypothetical protein